LSPRRSLHAVFDNPPFPADGVFRLSGAPGLGLAVNEAELAKRIVPVG
jgi:L-alanine-DL-glutamate epimerase-like enolase superfamily enzyme